MNGFSFISFIGNNRTSPTTENNYLSLEIRYSGVQLYLKSSHSEIQRGREGALEVQCESPSPIIDVASKTMLAEENVGKIIFCFPEARTPDRRRAQLRLQKNVLKLLVKNVRKQRAQLQPLLSKRERE